VLDLNTVMINSEDPPRLAAFWTTILGEPGFRDEAYTGWKAGSAFLMVGPHSEVKGVNEMPGRMLINFETADVQGEFERLKGLGATVVQEPYRPGGDDMPDMMLATLADPDGNYFQLASPMPEM
jgi:predicted enzyme related to lactoylglutathione lyase